MSHDSGELRRTLESLRDRPDELVGIILRQSGRISRLEAEPASLEFFSVVTWSNSSRNLIARVVVAPRS